MYDSGWSRSVWGAVGWGGGGEGKPEGFGRPGKKTQRPLMFNSH